MGADAGSGSTNLNAIPRSGGNSFRTTVDGYFSNGGMQGENLNDYLRSFNINSAAEVVDIYRIGAQFGGPIMRDKVWFFAAVGRWGSRVNQPGASSTLQGIETRRPDAVLSGQPGTLYANASYDTGRPLRFDWYRTHSLRATWQVAERHRSAGSATSRIVSLHHRPFTGANAIESERGWDWWPAGVVRERTAPLTNRLLRPGSRGRQPTG
jgi:hypothetical protein